MREQQALEEVSLCLPLKNISGQEQQRRGQQALLVPLRRVFTTVKRPTSSSGPLFFQIPARGAAEGHRLSVIPLLVLAREPPSPALASVAMRDGSATSLTGKQMSREPGFTFRRLQGIQLNTSSVQLLVVLGGIILAVAITVTIFGMVHRLFDSQDLESEEVWTEKASVRKTGLAGAPRTVRKIMTVLGNRDGRHGPKALRKRLFDWPRKHTAQSHTTKRTSTEETQSGHRASTSSTSRRKGAKESGRRDYGPLGNQGKVATGNDYKSLLSDYESIIAVIPDDYDLDFGRPHASPRVSIKGVNQTT